MTNRCFAPSHNDFIDIGHGNDHVVISKKTWKKNILCEPLPWGLKVTALMSLLLTFVFIQIFGNLETKTYFWWDINELKRLVVVGGQTNQDVFTYFVTKWGNSGLISDQKPSFITKMSLRHVAVVKSIQKLIFLVAYLFLAAYAPNKISNFTINHLLCKHYQ